MSEPNTNLVDAEPSEDSVVGEGGSIVLATKVLPSVIPIIPLRPRPVFIGHD